MDLDGTGVGATEGLQNTQQKVAQADEAMAKSIHKCHKRRLSQDSKCLLEIHVTVQSEPLDPEPGNPDKNDSRVAEFDGTEARFQPLKLYENPSVERVLSTQKRQRRKLQLEEGAVFKLLHGGHGNMLFRMKGRKVRPKYLIKASIFKSFGQMMGLAQGGDETKQITTFDGVVRFKRDGIPSQKILREFEADKLLANVERMKRLSTENEKIMLPGMAESIRPDVMRYWLRRYSLFSRFDSGIKIDEEGLFSVTPEEIAKHRATHCVSGTVIDAFTGVGGNAIQFALLNFNVVAIDIDPKKIEYAQNNARVYGVADKIDFIVGDFFQLATSLKADVAFLSPPWGGPEYIRAEKYDIETMLRPKNGFDLFNLALSVAPSVAFFLPRTVDTEQLARLSHLTNPHLPYKIEKNYVHDEVKAVTAYYGKVARAMEARYEACPWCPRQQAVLRTQLGIVCALCACAGMRACRCSLGCMRMKHCTS